MTGWLYANAPTSACSLPFAAGIVPESSGASRTKRATRAGLDNYCRRGKRTALSVVDPIYDRTATVPDAYHAI
jgi:hypothetical protein